MQDMPIATGHLFAACIRIIVTFCSCAPTLRKDPSSSFSPVFSYCDTIALVKGRDFASVFADIGSPRYNCGQNGGNDEAAVQI
jgi:hypothetical protein